MKKIIKILAAIAIAAAAANGTALEKRAKSKAAAVMIKSDSALSAGNNTLQLDISLKNNDSGIKSVSLKAFMPAMPGMPAMESTNEAIKKAEGVYESELNFSMSGTWQLHIFIIPNEGRKIRVKSSVNVN